MTGSTLIAYSYVAAKTQNNKNTVTVTAPAPIADNRNMLFVILFRMRQYFMFLIIHIFAHPQGPSFGNQISDAVKEMFNRF